VFVWEFGVLFLSCVCVCVGVGGVVLCRCVCGVLIFWPPAVHHSWAIALITMASITVVGCKIPRKENSPIFLLFSCPPPLPVSPGSPEVDPTIDQNKALDKKNRVDWKLLAGLTRKKASTRRVNRKIADSTRNQRVFFSRYLAANCGTEASHAVWSLTFTRDSFVYSGSVHSSILFLAFNTFIAPPPLCFAINCAIYGFPPHPPPCFAIQHTILVIAISCQGQYRARSSRGSSGSQESIGRAWAGPSLPF